MELLEVLTKSS